MQKLCTQQGRWRWFVVRQKFRLGKMWKLWEQEVVKMVASFFGKCCLASGLWIWLWVAIKSLLVVMAKLCGATLLGWALTQPKAPNAHSVASYRYELTSFHIKYYKSKNIFFSRIYILLDLESLLCHIQSNFLKWEIKYSVSQLWWDYVCQFWWINYVIHIGIRLHPTHTKSFLSTVVVKPKKGSKLGNFHLGWVQ